MEEWLKISLPEVMKLYDSIPIDELRLYRKLEEDQLHII